MGLFTPHNNIYTLGDMFEQHEQRGVCAFVVLSAQAAPTVELLQPL